MLVLLCNYHMCKTFLCRPWAYMLNSCYQTLMPNIKEVFPLFFSHQIGHHLILMSQADSQLKGQACIKSKLSIALCIIQSYKGLGESRKDSFALAVHQYYQIHHRAPKGIFWSFISSWSAQKASEQSRLFLFSESV